MSSDMAHFAVAEKSITGQPNVYIYSFKTLKLYRILRKGTERGYASVQFSHHNKNHIAALGCAPDYLLSVWDWKNERLLLKCKAYGQDIFTIRWGQFPGMLTSAGVGHVKFWKMATTFTGLKLQGDLGKFGASELSDISGFVELPDGKKVTGTEYGKLLLWEGVFVKVELMKSDPAASGEETSTKLAGSPHTGAIDVLLLDKDAGLVISGGDDGYLRWWPIDEIDLAEADYDAGILEYGITMRKEVRIPPSSDSHGMRAAHIQHITRSGDDRHWLIQDVRNGVVWSYDTESGACTPVISAHTSQITGALISARYPGLVVSSGIDGTLRAFNVSTQWDNELFTDARSLSGERVGISCMDATPEIVDPEGRTICCAYTDGTVRAFSMCDDGFLLIQALKPHNCMVSQLAYTEDESGLLATLAEDNTIFFFQVHTLSEHAIPVGYVQVPCKVNRFTWQPNTGNMLLSLEDGSLVELLKPAPEYIDNSETFEITLGYRSVVPEVPDLESEDEGGDEEEDEEGEGSGEGGGEEGEGTAEGQAEEESGKKKKGKKKKGKDYEEQEEGEEDEKKHVQVVANTILRAIYLPADEDGDNPEVVLFTGTGRYSGALWQCSLADAKLTHGAEVPLGKNAPEVTAASLWTKLPKGAAVTYLSVSPSKRFIFVGFADGRLLVVPVRHSNLFSSICLADGFSGAINSVTADPDETMLVVAAGDGTLVTVSFNAEGLVQVANVKGSGKDIDMEDAGQQLSSTMPEIPNMATSTWAFPRKDASAVIPINSDVTDRSFYSIQDQKRKSEEDNAKAAADHKKIRVNDRIKEIRQELVDLIAKSAEGSNLSSTDMAVDQEYIAHLNQDMEHQIEQVRFELSWAVEYHERGLQKLRDHYLSRVDFERVEVLGFRSPHRVATFRCPAMSEDLQSNLAKLHELIFAAEDGTEEEDSEDEEGGNGTDGRSLAKSGGVSRSELGHEVSGDMTGGGSEKEHLTGAQERELRRQQRTVRNDKMQELEKSKPSDTTEDPRDLDQIAHAQATLGNYMLKTSDTYQVPENQRMNAEKKRRQMFLLEESMHAIKTEFNHRVLALRDFRQQVRAEVERDLLALREIDDQLGTTTDWVNDLLDGQEDAPAEFPEQRFEYDDIDIKAFARQLKGEGAEEQIEPGDEEADDEDDEDDEDEGMEDEEEGDEDGGEEGADGEEHGEGVEGDDVGAHDAKKAAAGGKKLATTGQASTGSGSSVPLSGHGALAARRVARLTLRAQLLQGTGASSNSLGKAVAQEAQARLRHDKGQLEDHVRQVIETFNTAVASIEKEKAKLESDLKNADMKLLVLYEELLALNELEEKDEALLKKATKCRQDKTNIMHQIKECQDQLGEKKAEIEQWHTEEQNLQAEFTDLVGENSPYLSALLKIYQKKVKRTKRKKTGEEEEFDEDEDEEDDEDEDMSDDEDEDEMDDDTGPPQGCDVQIYESVIDLREKRLDMADALKEISDAVTALKQTHKKLLDEEKRIDKEQKMTDTEIQQFQTDKQRKLNQVQIVFALRLSQVQCLASSPAAGDDCDRLPAQLDEQVIFTQEGLKRLMSRITELHREKSDVKGDFKQLQRDFRAQIKEKKNAQKGLEDLHAKFQDIQMLKFGQTVDLDLIERSAPNKYVQELHGKVGEAEIENRRHLGEWDKKIERQKKELAKSTRDNTSLMEQIVSMGYSQMQLDAALNARIANVTVNDNEPLNELREMERERLKDLLALQSKEIATLQAEITLFRKKGGHIYTTVTANRGR
ncbi:unnamed protein product [Polarella glacialis]|uniref:Cilia- and flagella-associated protein 43 n=1 Tax=Polarella glacialis TaxID=89957 RepID=A0A813ITI3_POLGL|nr:unnamed protein product [Polarella glacialis]